MGNDVQKRSLLNKNYLLLILCNTTTSVAFYMVSNLLVKFVTAEGVSLSDAGFLAGLFSLTALAIRPFSGVMADRLKKKQLIFIGVTLLALGTFGMSITKNYGLMLAFRIIQGIGFALNGTTCIALASAFMPEDKIGQGVGYFALSNVIATSVGPTLGLAILDHGGSFQAMFIVAAVFPLISAALVLMVDPDPQEAVKTERRGISFGDLISVKLLPFMFFTAAFSMINGLISSFLVTSAEAKGITAFSAYFTIHPLCLLAVRPLAGSLSDKKGGAFVLTPAYVFAAVAALLVGIAGNRWLLFAAAVFAALGMGAGSPTCQSECIKRLGPEQRGLAVSTYYIGADVAQGLAPTIGGKVAEGLGYPAMYYIACAFSLLAGLIYFLYTRREKRQTPQAPVAE